MDQELISYFDARFGEVSQRIEENTQQIAALREEMGQRFEKVEDRLERVEDRLEKVEDRFEKTDERLERVEGRGRQTQVMIEAMRGDVQLLAEGIVGYDEKLQAHNGEITLRLDQLKAMVAPLYRSLDHRVHQLEQRATLEGRDPIEIIRERFTKKT